MGNGENDFRRDRAMSPAAAKSELNPIPPPIFGSGLSRIFSWSRSGIGLRLLAAVLLFSSIVTLTLTALQLYLEYDREVGVIETRLDEIGRSYPGSLGESLWNLDQNQLELQLNGHPAAAGRPGRRDPRDRRSAESDPDRGRRARHPLGDNAANIRSTTSCREAARQIGVLHVEATLTEVYRQLLNRALVILASQAAKTFLVSLLHHLHVPSAGDPASGRHRRIRQRLQSGAAAAASAPGSPAAARSR